MVQAPSDAGALAVEGAAGEDGAAEASAPPPPPPLDAGAAAETSVPTASAKIVLLAGGLMTPFGVAVDPIAGDLYVADYGDSTVRRVSATGMSTVVVGPGASGPAATITLNKPHDLLFQPGTRNLFIADTFAGRVIRMDVSTGAATVFAGGGAAVPASGMTFCLAFDPPGKVLYFISGGRIAVADVAAGTPKTTINYANPRVIAVDSKGTLYAVMNTGTGPATLQTVDPASGAGTDVPGGGPLAAPKHIAIDGNDDVVIADTEGFVVRKYVVASKNLVPVAGNGKAGTGMLDGPPALAQLTRPHGIFVDHSGRIVIADSFNNRVLGILP
jgi:DNA-binding beta-propeller fold protein YncE